MRQIVVVALWSAATVIATGCQGVPGSIAEDGGTDGGQSAALIDDSFADFAKGTLSDAGAKIYVSKDGAVRLVDNWDLNGDGRVDLIIAAVANLPTDRFSPTHSFIFWGSDRGLDPKRFLKLPTIGLGSAVADVDADGYPDVVYAKLSGRLSKDTKTTPVIYRGSKSGPSANRRDEVSPPVSELQFTSLDIADFDRDGYLDIVLAGDGAFTSYIYWGSGDGYSVDHRTKLTTYGSPSVAVADFNGDGDLDVFFPSTYSEISGQTSFFYWGGGKKRFKQENRTAVSIPQSFCATPADMNNDGHIDLVLGLDVERGGEILWGDGKGPPGSKRTRFATIKWPHELTVADIDGDGHLDVVYAEAGSGKAGNTSQIFWGPAFDQDDATVLDTYEAVGVMVADFNADGKNDVVFTEIRKNGGDPAPALVYTNLGKRSFSKEPLELIAPGGYFSTTTDLGSVSRRTATETFTSRVFDAGDSGVRYDEIAWKVSYPPNAKATVDFQLRSAAEREDIADASWMGPTSTGDAYRARRGNRAAASINGAHDGHRFIQYRAVLGSAFTGGPVLEKVTIKTKPAE